MIGNATTANLFELILGRAPADRGRVLLEADGQAWSWAEMDTATAHMARLLVNLGLVKGDRVAVRAEKSPEALFLYLACLRAGLVYLPMNTAYSASEVNYLIGNAEPAVVVCDPAAESEVGSLAVRHRVRRLLTLGPDGEGSLTDLAAGQPADFAPVRCAPNETAAILYTSGTTGRPKGAMLSHRNLAANGEALRGAWAFTAADVLLHALPLFHAHGLFVACHTVLLAGARMIWLQQFDRARVLAELPRATVFMGVPTYYTRLLADPGLDREACRTVRLFVSGSAPLLEDTFRAFAARTGHAVLERYGMTETGMNTSNPYDGERRPGSVGPPLPGVSARVAGEDVGLLGPGEVGVLQVQGDNVFGGYWRMPERTAEDFTADGWFITGDLARIDPDGYVTLVGRAKDLIISGGYNVYPKEVEDVIDAIDGIDESAVIGVPHPDFGEAVVAVVMAAPGPQPAAGAVIAAARRHLANYKVPKRVVFVDELPRNAMGKVQKTLLRQSCAGLFAAAGGGP